MKLFSPVFGLGVMAACWSRPVPPAPDRTVTVGVEASSFRLDNGLRVVLVPDPRASQISVTMQYAVGSSDDPEGSEGLAHVVEHVMFEPLLDGRSLLSRLQDAALELNGNTGPDVTTYTARAWPAQLPELLAIEAARLDQRCASVTDEAFTRAREIVRNELREREASWQVLTSLDAAVFPSGHPYHRDAPTLASLGAITRDQACAFADAHYGTANAVLVVSGPIGRHELTAALAPTLGRIHREVSAQTRAAPPISRHTERIEVPLKSPAVAIVWPMPDDPVASTRVATMIDMLARLVRTQVNAATGTMELGGSKGRAMAIVLIPSPDTTIEQALAGVKRASSTTWYGSAMFEAARERSVYELVESFEDGVGRDRWIGDQVLAGRDPNDTLEARLEAVHGMSLDQGGRLARALTLDTATIVTMVPDPHARTEVASVAPPIHEMPRAHTADPTAATAPAAGTTSHALGGLRVRTLPSGLRVVLAATTSVHTFDARLVFPAGTAAEPAGERGVALLAARGLDINPGDGPLMLRFATGGGLFETAAETDDTVFAVRGLTGQLDQGLSALAQLVSDGVYGNLRDTRDELRRDAVRDRDDLLATRLWRRARFGDAHPYVDAGLWARANSDSPDQVAAFRAAYYVPTGATLIITGGFDPDLADRWIDYAFADWRGESAPPQVPAARPAALAFAQPRTSSQIAFRVAFGVSVDRARALVMAEMVSQAVGDVRESLSASYGVYAALDETRAGASIVVSGRVDAARAADAFALIHDRIAKLRVASDDTMVRFVEARARVADRLEAIPTDASSLAARITDAVARGRAPDEDDRTAEAVRALTIDRLQPALARLDLDAAAILMRGPEEATSAAYAALGRDATIVR